MSIQSHVINSTTQKTYNIGLEGCEPRDWPHSRTGKTYRPCRLVVVKRDGNVSSVELSGPHIKKDGTDGEMWAAEKFFGINKRPAWLDSIIGGLA